MLALGSTGHGKGHDRRIGGWGNGASRDHPANLTVDPGRGDPGAVGVDFLASSRGGTLECYALYSMTNPAPGRATPMLENDGGQKSCWTTFEETQAGQTRQDQTWRRETMRYLGGGE
jgi:hypothetical protein